MLGYRRPRGWGKGRPEVSRERTGMGVVRERVERMLRFETASLSAGVGDFDKSMIWLRYNVRGK